MFIASELYALCAVRRGTQEAPQCEPLLSLLGRRESFHGIVAALTASALVELLLQFKNFCSPSRRGRLLRTVMGAQKRSKSPQLES